MPYQPRLTPEILQEMVGQVVSQSELTDLSEGSVFLTLLGAVAEQIESTEFRLKTIRDSYALDNAEGVDLDERLADLPGTKLRRIGKTAASGDVLSITRAVTTGSEVLPAGSLFGRTNAPGILYATTSDVTFGIGVATVDNIRVSCLKYGTIGNCAAQSINQIVKAPSNFIGVSQTVAITTGADRETDPEVRSRAKAYLASLSTSTPDALRAAALTYISTNGVRARHAAVFEDLQRPAYSELVVDDGSGFSGFTRPSTVTSGTVPLQGTIQLYHDAPADRHLTKIKVNGTVIEYPNPDTNPTWVSVPERGIVQLKDGQTDIGPGDTWVIGDTDTAFNVYTGFVSELQSIVEGTSSNPTVNFGKRDAGLRVRVVPPEVVLVDLIINLILKPGVIVADAIAATNRVVEEFFSSLAPGKTMYLSDLYRVLDESLEQYAEAVDILKPTENFAPSSARISLRAGNIVVT